MTRRTGMFAVLLAAFLVLVGCKDNAEPTTGAEAHFLETCSSDTDCGSALACICGICTQACAGVHECLDIEVAASCHSTAFEDEAVCPGSDVLVCSSLEPCGDGTCTGGEDCTSCPEDCGECGTICDDGTCSIQDVNLCPMTGDCVCGDDICEEGAENCENCEADCGPCVSDTCSDGLCRELDFLQCPDDGDCVCGDNYCDIFAQEPCYCREDCPGRFCP